MRAQQATRGGKVKILERRNELPGVSEEEVADLERLHLRGRPSIALHKYLGDYLPTKRGKGLDWTLGEDAVALGRKTGYDYALFMHAEDRSPRPGGSRSGARHRRLLRRLLRAQHRRRDQLDYARWST